MSLTNPNTPVSQQDLQDFYHKLLPYMGGSFGMIANKFSKGDMYSTDERMIGQWVDGKPLYQKTFYISALTDKSILTVSHGISNIGELVSITGTMSNGTDRSRPLPYVHDTTLGNQANIFLTPTTFEIDNRGSDYSSYHAYVTLRYTKTTDSAISIGDDTDYSTEEKIVGTWIDGSPIYQKVFPTTATMGSSYTIMISDTTEYNIAGIVKCYGIRYYPVGTTTMQSVPMLAYIDINASAKPVYCYMYGAAAQFNYIILQYTKTTD